MKMNFLIFLRKVYFNYKLLYCIIFDHTYRINIGRSEKISKCPKCNFLFSLEEFRFITDSVIRRIRFHFLGARP